MGQALAATTNVLILSSMYILVALGFALLFSMLGLLNFAMVRYIPSAVTSAINSR